MSALQEVFASFSIDFDPGGALERGGAAIGDLTSKIQGAVGAFAAMAAIPQISSFVHETVEMASAIDDTAQVLGISTRELQEWQHVARLSGAEVSDFTGSFMRLQDRMAAGGAGLSVFRELGVSVRDANGDLRSASDVLMDLADPIARVENDAERTGLLIDLLGRSGARLGPLFSRGAAGVAEVREELSRLGGGLSEEAIAEATELGDAWDRMDTITTSLRGSLAVYLIPAVRWASEAIQGLTENTGALERGLQTVGVVLTGLAVATYATWGPIIYGAAMSIAPILLLGLAVEDLITMFRGGESVIGGVMDALGGDGTAMEFVTALTDAWRTFVETFRAVQQYVYDDVQTDVGERTASGDRRVADRGLDQTRGVTLRDTIREDLERADRIGGTTHTPAELEGLIDARMEEIAARVRGPQQPTTIDQSITIERIDASGLTADQAEQVVARAVRTELSRQGDDTLDALAGGALE